MFICRRVVPNTAPSSKGAQVKLRQVRYSRAKGISVRPSSQHRSRESCISKDQLVPTGQASLSSQSTLQSKKQVLSCSGIASKKKQQSGRCNICIYTPICTQTVESSAEPSSNSRRIQDHRVGCGVITIACTAPANNLSTTSSQQRVTNVFVMSTETLPSQPQ